MICDHRGNPTFLLVGEESDLHEFISVHVPSDVLFKVPVLMHVVVEFWRAFQQRESVCVCVDE